MHGKQKLSLELLLHLLLGGVSTYLLLTTLPTILPAYKLAFAFIIAGIIFLDLYFIFSKKTEYLNITKMALFYLSFFVFIILLVFYATKFLVLTDVYGIEHVLRANESAAKWLFFLICFAQPIVLPLPEAVTLAAGSAVFGPFEAAYLGFLGTISGILLMFFITRSGGQKIVLKFVKEKHLQKYQAYVGENETVILALLFIIPILPDEIICIGAGLGGVSFKRFLIIASVSKILTSSLLAYSVQLAKLLPLTSSQLILACSATAVIFWVVSLLIKKTLRKKKKRMT
jgi:uncharacterized membrane protein YdjX (TVP38/TMEM64 family)